MTAFNVVRFRVKPGQEQQFIEAHRKARPGFKGFAGGWLVRTGDQTFCMVGQWRTFQSIVNARPEMIGLLDGMRDMLEDLGGGLGVTDPVSGEAVVKLAASKPAKKRPSRPRRKAKRATARRAR
jgi:hypothetical protein